MYQVKNKKEIRQTAAFTEERFELFEDTNGNNGEHCPIEESNEEGSCFDLQVSTDNKGGDQIWGNLKEDKDQTYLQFFRDTFGFNSPDPKPNSNSTSINKNCQKYLVSMFVKFYGDYIDYYYRNDIQGRQKLIELMKKYKIHYQTKKSFKLDHLSGIFQSFMNHDTKRNLLNRKIMHKIISQKMWSEVVDSSQMKDKLCYLKIGKMFLTRLRSSSLVQRVQIPH